MPYQRLPLPHGIPPWVKADASFFLTLCCTPRGLNQLAKPEAFQIIQEAFHFYEAQHRLNVLLLLAMPDHLHAIVRFPPLDGMKRTIAKVKEYAARRAHIRWQDGFFDHRIRDPQSSREKWLYIQQNPVRKALVSTPEAWPFQVVRTIPG